MIPAFFACTAPKKGFLPPFGSRPLSSVFRGLGRDRSPFVGSPAQGDQLWSRAELALDQLEQESCKTLTLRMKMLFHYMFVLSENCFVR